METQIIDKTLQECNFDIDLTISKLRELCITSPEPNPTPVQVQQPTSNVINQEDLKWVEVFVNEMSMATSIDDARARAAMALASRDKEKRESTSEQLEKQNLKLSQQNCVLKRLVVAQHERLKEFEEARKDVEKMSRMITQCTKELRVSEMNNYALKVRLNQAHIGCSSMVSTNFPPDVY